MFRGNTTVEMNQTTMVEAVQEWLDRRTSASHPRAVVKSVTGKGSGYEAGKTFTLELEEGKPLAPQREAETPTQAG